MSDSTQHGASAQTQHAMLKVQGNCDMCKERIETAAKSVDGVSSAMWDNDTKQLHLNFYTSKTSVNAVAQAVAAVGHDNEKYKADGKAYDALPSCCRYRK
jgi:Cu(I)/Ag(I) efflux system membrane fusion protein